MDLRLFFNPVPEEIFSEIKKQGSFFKNIQVYQEKFPDYRRADIALIGISDAGEGGENAGTVGGADALRKKLYRLSKGSGAYNIVDLGNISEAIDTEQTFGRVQEVCHACIEHNVLPILIGGSQDMSFAQYLAYEEMGKLVSVLNVDAFLDMEDKDAPANQQHVQKMLMHQPNFLFNYSHLAYQTYLVNPQAIATLEKLYFDAYRIGALRHDIKEMEPLIRQADMMSFDLSAIKASDLPATTHAQPFGLTGEEACQLCWYAGINEKLSAVGFYEFDASKDVETDQSAAVLATMIWYFIEGFYHRKESRDFRSNDYMKYVVSMPTEPEILTFYKSNFMEKWWMEVPNPSGNNRFDRNSIVPCSYSDYQQALKGELPERWIVMHSKLF